MKSGCLTSNSRPSASFKVKGRKDLDLFRLLQQKQSFSPTELIARLYITEPNPVAYYALRKRLMQPPMSARPQPKKARMSPGPVKCTISKSRPAPSSPARTSVHITM